MIARLVLAVALLWAGAAVAEPPPEVVVGSKTFTESVVLGEIAAGLARSAGARVRYRRALGGTRILWRALRRGDIDVYPEYSGTLIHEIFAGVDLSGAGGLEGALAQRGLRMTAPLGFNNSYVIAVRPGTAARLGLETISDLAGHPDLRLGFSNEFMDRGDGWPALRARYGLGQRDVRGLDHDLAYRGLAAGDIDVMDAYATDADIDYYGVTPLADDLGHFPEYAALLLTRADLAARAPAVARALDRLAGGIDAGAVRALSIKVKRDGLAERRVAADFLRDAFAITVTAPVEGFWRRLGRHGLAHLALVAISLGAAIVVAIPLGVLAHRRRRLGQVILAAVGIIQTIPSLALLVFMIPLLGIGGPPAVVALFLYSLLPIVRNCHAGLSDIPPGLRDSAQALGLPPGPRLRLIELPLAGRAILAGIKTSAVINVGTATLGALIGAGGFGQPILTGIRLDDVGLILEGAVPAALLALIVQGLFELAERAVVPRGLRLAAAP